MKIVAVSSMPDKTTLKLSFGKWFAFACGWAGMRPQPFETLGEPSQPGATRMISFGISRLLLGLLLVYVTRLLIHHNIIPGNSLGYIITALLLLIGFSLILHFGLLSISAGMWRLQGAATYYLFRRPAAALSITEFWGKRWNLAFSEMTSIAIFRPLKQRFGNTAAVFVSFVFSGLLHELALSVPVNAGYGLSTLYFLAHAFIVALERTIQKRCPLFLANKTTAHIWVFFWLVLPAPLLFHPQFINGVVLPLADLSPISLPQ
ncbi:wax synthase family protein [Mucilaginibacter achroorhodeus]|nr:membrane bound O-acyl transferase family-domain-containing protein [Mucilaginibacter achroorhodeus]